VKSGKVVISCQCRDDLTQQQGFLHGGVVTTIADVTCGYTALTMIPASMSTKTVKEIREMEHDDDHAEL
jgi:acyl-coenzyme A thioesterase PaaI-like protein